MSISLIAEVMSETLSKMEENRAENQKLLKQKKSLIIKQISTGTTVCISQFILEDGILDPTDDNSIT
jgi:hypothetical protein